MEYLVFIVPDQYFNIYVMEKGWNMLIEKWKIETKIWFETIYSSIETGVKRVIY